MFYIGKKAGETMVETSLMSLAIEAYQRLLPELKLKQNVKASPVDQPEPWNLAPLMQLPTVGQTLYAIKPVPYQSILIGACEDGLPFLLDLAQPSAGPVLVTGDAKCGKTHQMKVMVESALRLASPREIQIGIVTGHPDEWDDLFDPYQRVKQSLGVFTWDSDALATLISSLADLVEARFTGKRNGPVVLLMVEDLSKVETLETSCQMTLHWLLENGPQVGVWAIASVQADQAVTLPYWVSVFRTRLFGRISSPELAGQLAVYPGLEAEQLVSGSEFCTRLEKSWMPYWVPESGD